MKTFTTHDGRTVDGSSEDWRAECEARAVLRMPTSDRQNYLHMVGKQRGKEAMRCLRNTVQTMWVDDLARELLALQRTDLLAAEQRLHRIGSKDALGQRLREGIERRMQEITSTTREEKAA
jgi:hypothetical protein